MPASDHLVLPDPHLDPVVAAAYDDPANERFGREAVRAAVGVLSDLARDRSAVEFAVGTGRLALPLAEAGVRVHGIDFSEPMLAELRRKGVSSSKTGFRNSAHYHIDGNKVRISSPAFRYVWPSELDLMAELAGMTLESRWADWDRSPFTGESQSHISVWRKP